MTLTVTDSGIFEKPDNRVKYDWSQLNVLAQNGNTRRQISELLHIPYIRVAQYIHANRLNITDGRPHKKTVIKTQKFPKLIPPSWVSWRAPIDYHVMDMAEVYRLTGFDG